MFTLDIYLLGPTLGGYFYYFQGSNIMGDNSPKDKAKKNKRGSEKAKKEVDAAKAKELAAASTKK